MLNASLVTYLPPSTQRLCIGYSGGLDSELLLHQLAETCQILPTLQLEAVHVHHGLHRAADNWVKHCENTCAALSVPLTVYRVNPGDYPDESPEAAARKARYAAFQSHLHTREDAVLVLAHHLDDQLETILHRLCRGTGVLGLSGMSVFTESSLLIKIFRPFLALNLDRAALEAMAAKRQLTWIEDSSNADLRFDRNFIRHEILPRLKQRWPHVTAAANRTALLCRSATDITEQQAQQGLSVVQYVVDEAIKSDQNQKQNSLEIKWDRMSLGSSLSAKKLLAFARKERHDILRVWLQEKGLTMPSLAQLSRLETEILTAASGRQPRIKMGDYIVARWRDRLFVYRPEGALV